MIVHDWPAWVNPAQPVVGPVSAPSKWVNVGIHYTAADNLIDGDPGEHASNLPQYLRNIQNDYTRNRGYSVGYNWAVDWLGGCWRLRGWGIRCAAHAGANDTAPAILMLVDRDDEATPEALAAARSLIADAEWLAGRRLGIYGHNELPGRTTPTACCGAGLRRQVVGGLFSPRYTPPAPAPTIPNDPEGNDDMVKLIVYVKDDPQRAEALVCMDGAGTEMIGFASVADRNALVGVLELKPVEITAAQYDDFLAHARA